MDIHTATLSHHEGLHLRLLAVFALGILVSRYSWVPGYIRDKLRQGSLD